MKKFIFFIFLISMFSLFSLFCQDTVRIDIGNYELFPKLLIFNQNNLFKISYKFLDGTDVSSADMKMGK